MRYFHFINKESTIILLVLSFLVFADKLFVQTVGSPGILTYSPYFLIAAPLLVIAIFFKLETWGLALLIFAIFTSPRLPVGTLVHGRAIDIRIEDIFLILLCFAWLLRFKRRPPQKTPFLYPILVYLGISIISTLAAIYFNRVDSSEAFFYLLKEVEYFLIFFLVANNITHKRQLNLLIWIFLGIGVADFCWKIKQIIVGTPFGGYGPGTFFEASSVQASATPLYGLAIAISLWIYQSNIWRKVGLTALILFFSVSVIMTGGRSIGIGLVAGLLIMALRSVEIRKLRLAIFFCLALCFLAISYFTLQHLFPGLTAHKRLTNIEAGIISGKERVRIWTSSIESLFLSSPILGAGKGSFPTSSGAHNHYVWLLCEVGVVGLFAFMWLWGSLWRNVHGFCQSNPDRIYKTVALSWIFVTATLFIANFGGAYLVSVRIAEPYWVIAGMAVGTIALAEKNQVKQI